MFLTAEELDTLTGSSRPFMQRRWLRDRCWIFEVSARGAPVVSRSYAEGKFGSSQQASKERTKVNLEAV
jgi:hypothetical protein